MNSIYFIQQLWAARISVYSLLCLESLESSWVLILIDCWIASKSSEKLEARRIKWTDNEKFHEGYETSCLFSHLFLMLLLLLPPFILKQHQREEKKRINFIESRRRDDSLCVDVDSYALCCKWHYKFTDDDNGKTVLRVDVSLHSSQVSRAENRQGMMLCIMNLSHSRHNIRDDMRLRWNDKFHPKWFPTLEKIYNVEEALAKWEFMEFLRKADEICLVERTYFKERKRCEMGKAYYLHETFYVKIYAKPLYVMFLKER